MPRLVFHEHPRQAGGCLTGAFDAYVGRIPMLGFDDLDAVWQSLRNRPFEADGRLVGADGSSCEGGACNDDRCSPAQRSRLWPDTMNCWEATAHFVAAARRFLGPSWTIHVWDRDLRNGARHVWPSLVSPSGKHLLVDLRSTALRNLPNRGYDAALSERHPANDSGEWYNDVLGVGHLAGGTALRFFGLGKVAEILEQVEGDALPDWARASPQSEAPAVVDPVAPEGQPAAGPAKPTQGPGVPAEIARQPAALAPRVPQAGFGVRKTVGRSQSGRKNTRPFGLLY